MCAAVRRTMVTLAFTAAAILAASSGARSVAGEGTSSEWSTVGANPERTSWVSEQVDPSTVHLEWYRPIDAYIPQNVQLITANGLVYVSTSRGLYALYAADPDGSGPLGAGDLKWRFDTEMPLGNSPTVVAGVAYVGGFDKKLHAVDANSGAHLWSFDGAKAGYSANPLVVNGVVIAANRDGSVYAIGAQGSSQQGQLIWKFNAGGAIVQSPAYHNGIVYLVASDNYGYAVNASTGALIWKSSKLPGDGFASYWPVVYQDKVIFSGASSYRENMDPGTGALRDTQAVCGTAGCPYDSIDRIQKDGLFFDKSTYGPVGPTVADTDPWAAGKPVMDGSRISEYLEDNPDGDAHLHKPWRRTFIVLNMADGTEYTQDTDGDGRQEYAPIAWWGTRSGNAYPPLVGADGVIYTNNVYLGDNETYVIPQGQVMGWRIGTTHLSLVGQQGADDEPQSISAGGNILYRSIACDRVGSWTDFTNVDRRGDLWGYADLSAAAPGYDVKWWGIDPAGGYPRLAGNYGDQNGIYHNHGVQNPFIPYQGRLFTHRSNAVLAFGPGAVRGGLPLLPAESVKDSPVAPSVTDLEARLDNEINKMLAAGNLRPGYFNLGQSAAPPMIKNYFENPGDTLYALSRAYPYLSTVTQSKLKSYLQTEFQTYFDPTMYARRGWVEGTPRESMPIPPEVAASMSRGNKSTWVGDNWSWYYPQYNFYAMWKYAQLFAGDPAYVQHIYDLAKGSLQVPAQADDTYLQTWVWELNGYIGGYIGFLNLQSLAGQSTTDASLRGSVTNELNRLLALRANTFTKETPWINPTNPNLPSDGGQYHYRAYNIARNWMMMVPELADYLYKNAPSKLQAAWDDYNSVAPYWFVEAYDATVDEGVRSPLDDVLMLQARAYGFKASYADVAKYVDVPAFQKGDIFYIQSLIAALDSSGTTVTPDPFPVPTFTATPTSALTAVPTAPPTVIATATPVPAPSNTECASGSFLAEYFSNISLSGGPSLSQCETSINHNWGYGSPSPSLPSDNFSVRWTGDFDFSPGSYTFTVSTDDGMRVYVDGALLIDAWKDQQIANYTATTAIPAGQHQVMVVYYERTEEAIARVAWTGGFSLALPTVTPTPGPTAVPTATLVPPTATSVPPTPTPLPTQPTSGSTITATPSNAGAGSSETVNWSKIPDPRASYVVALYSMSGSNAIAKVSEMSFAANGASSGSLSFRMPTAPGSYQFRLLDSNGSQLAASKSITVKSRNGK